MGRHSVEFIYDGEILNLTSEITNRGSFAMVHCRLPNFGKTACRILYNGRCFRVARYLTMNKFSAVVLGSGLAGLSVALRLADAGQKLLLSASVS